MEPQGSGSGLATVAGSVMAGYVIIGVDLKYLIAASFMAAPGGFLMAKMIVPETETPKDNLADLDLDDENEITFKVQIEGTRPGKPMCRLMIENHDINFALNGKFLENDEVSIV